jgi:two-component system phosphate regulon sensor histidine kinase PhoR
MLRKASQLNLARRIVGYYLLFGVAAVMCLFAGLPLLVQDLFASQVDNACLNRLGKIGARLVSVYVRQGEAALQPTVERARAEGALVYCAVVGKDGRYLAHSTVQETGREAQNPSGDVEQWGEARRVRYIDSLGRIVREFRTPLKKGRQELGQVCIAVLDPGIRSAIQVAAEYGGIAVAAPAVVIIAGAVRLRRLVRPMVDVERQLRRAAGMPAGTPCEFTPIHAGGAVAEGWNRLLGQRGAHDRSANLEQRLGHVLDGFRHRKAEQILNGLPDGVAVTDPDGKITFANQALCALIGWGDQPIEGRMMAECLRLDAANKTDQQLLAAEAQMRDVVVELGRSGDMSQGVLRVARFPLRTTEQTTGRGHIWSVRDITQQKLADQMRNQFVYSATHELRTPLANIKAYAETLGRVDAMDVEKQKEFCNIINAEATRLARFIDDLLSISRMQAGSLALDRQPTDLERLLNETIEHVRPQMVQKNIAFETSLPEKLPELNLDKDKIAVALVNLLGNAAKYTPPGGRVGMTVEVTAQQIHVHVEDSGIGIAVEDLPKLFDKFFRSSDPRVQEETGSGLGLSLAQEVVRLHGGRITVHSELDKGSKFTMSLPIS